MYHNCRVRKLAMCIEHAPDGPHFRPSDVERWRAESTRARTPVVTAAQYVADLQHVADVAGTIATETNLPVVLDRIVSAASSCIGGLATNSILLLDQHTQTVRHAASIGLPEMFVAGIDGQQIGPAAGTCGTAMYYGRTTITEDLMVDSNWDLY